MLSHARRAVVNSGNWLQPPLLSYFSKFSQRANMSGTSTTSRAPLTAINLTFLGTASAQPSSSRNHSSLALRLGGDVWLFDCGEATQHQLQKSSVKMGKIEKIFITHTHGDHIFGIVPLMCSLLNGAGGTAEGEEDPRLSISATTTSPALEIYGPLGTRAYIRNAIVYTHTKLGAPYVVHELRLPTDPQDGDHTLLPPPAAEVPGKNIPQESGVWTGIYEDSVVSVSAAPILHSVPCVGFTVLEAPVPGKIDPSKYIPDLKRTKTPMSAMRRLQQGETLTLADGTILHGPAKKRGRKIVILGDTFDPSMMMPIAEDATLLIHEATNAYLPGIDLATKEDETYATVEARTKSRGHSTPQMAGAFAKQIRAQQLVLNHFSSRYPGDESTEALQIMQTIADLAAREFGQTVTCARDLMSMDIGFTEK
ncbi:beta-lactamase-like protein [Crepidotus variabilis]|uniref:Beta-lactamase-like protein n=1 Tax=Crepidotus variabilis TaxID=179855 RepID=A0A9P6JWM9_9AGAR|nr:beta-lactamase-like protein [Crepidotus variabilis]